MSIPVNLLIKLSSGLSWLMVECSSGRTLNASQAMTTMVDADICNDGRWALVVGRVGSIWLILEATHTVVTA